MGRPPEIRFDCAGCGSPRSVTLGAEPDPGCRCGRTAELVIPEGLLERGLLERCAACGEHRIYRQKDFNRRAGLAVVIAGVALSLAVLPFSPMGAYAVLFAMAIIDGILYWRLPEVVICYRCKAQHRGHDPSSALEPFDLLTAELIDHQLREPTKPTPSDPVNPRT